MTKEQRKQLDEISVKRKEAKERGDWKTVHECTFDWSFVFRQTLR